MGPAEEFDVSPDAARAEVERVLSAGNFANAPKLTRMFRYVVEQALSGKARDLKEYTVGSEIFGRGADFDPRIDPIVRVQARRLRAKLDQYYEDPRNVSTVRIRFPKGGYAPLFERVSPAAVPEAAADAPIRSIAVLPFDDCTAAKANGALCAGATEDLIHTLTRQKRWRVVGAVSAFAFKGGRDLAQVRADLGVSHVLAGEVEETDGRYRVTARLLDAETGAEVWRTAAERPRSQFPELPPWIGARLLDQAAELPEEPAAVARLDAYQLYFEGRAAWRERTPESIRAALQLFERAKAADARCALAYAGIADCYMIAGMHGAYPPQWVFPHAKTMAKMAVQLDPGLGEAYASLGLVASAFEWDHEAADAAFRRAIELNPGYSVARHWRAVLYLAPHGLLEEAIAELRLATQCDPLSSVIRADLACVLQIAGRTAEAEEACAAALRADSGCLRSMWVMAFLLERQQRPGEALAVLERLADRAPDKAETPTIASSLAMAHSMAGEHEAAKAALESLLKAQKRRYVSEYCLAVAHLAVFDIDGALHWLESGCNQRCGGMYWLPVDPRWAQIAAHPRFVEVVRRLNLLPFQPERIR